MGTRAIHTVPCPRMYSSPRKSWDAQVDRLAVAEKAQYTNCAARHTCRSQGLWATPDVTNKREELDRTIRQGSHDVRILFVGWSWQVKAAPQGFCKASVKWRDGCDLRASSNLRVSRA